MRNDARSSVVMCVRRRAFPPIYYSAIKSCLVTNWSEHSDSSVINDSAASCAADDLMKNASPGSSAETPSLQQETIKRRKLSFPSFAGANLSFRKTETSARSCFNRKEETTYKLFMVFNFQASHFSSSLAHCSIGKVFVLLLIASPPSSAVWLLLRFSSRNHNAH